MVGMIRRALLAVAVLGALLAAPAQADDVGQRNHRLASREVCLDRPASIRGWHLAEAAEAWTATGLVTIMIKASCAGAPARVVITETWNPNEDAGETSWPTDSYMYGGRRSETDPTQWLYPQADIVLNTNHLRWMDRSDRRCWGWFVATHELGHALGLWHETGRSRIMSNEFNFRKHCWELPAGDVATLAALGYPSA